MTGSRAEALIIRPQPGPQERFLSSPADIAIAGGAAGVGKTWALLLEPLRHYNNPEFGAVFFRRTYPQITNEGGLWDETQKIYPHIGGLPRESSLEWNFPSGMRVKFAHLQYEKDRLDWKGAQIPLMLFDQLEEFTEGQFWYMLSRSRSMCGVRPYVRATVNPVPDDDEVGGWLNRLIAWWIDPETGYPIWERSGVLRWFIRLNDTIEWADSPDELRSRFADVPAEDFQPKSVTFIPGTLADNRALLKVNPEYRANLLALPYIERERLLGGNWKIRATAGKVFNRAWFEIVDAVPADGYSIRYWDKAGTEGGGKRTAGVRMKRCGGLFVIEDVEKGQWSAHHRETVIRQKAEADGRGVVIWIEQEPGSGGKESAENSIRGLAGFDVRADRVTGDKLTRSGPLSAQAEAGNVKLVRGPWNEDFLKEAHAYEPTAKFKDQIDASAGAFNHLALGAGPGASVLVPPAPRQAMHRPARRVSGFILGHSRGPVAPEDDADESDEDL